MLPVNMLVQRRPWWRRSLSPLSTLLRSKKVLFELKETRESGALGGPFCTQLSKSTLTLLPLVSASPSAGPSDSSSFEAAQDANRP